MEAFPFHHKNQVFNVYTDYDLTFVELRGILDELLTVENILLYDENAEWTSYKVHVENFIYDVWVFYPDLIIPTRNAVQR